MAVISQNKLNGFFDRYVKVVEYIKEDNSHVPNTNQHIKQVQIPSSLTQSLAYYFIVDNYEIFRIRNFNRNDLVEGSIRTYDFIYKHLNIEIKATGTNTYQRFRPKARSAHIVIWLNFDLNSRTYDIAIFNPKNLERIKPDTNKDVDINWDKILNWNTTLGGRNVKIIRGKTIQ